MTVTADRTLGEIVTADPASARVLERFGLDYCCGGSRTLADSCASKGVDLADVMAALDALEPPPAPPDWATMSPAELVDHLEATHHRYLHEELPRLAALAEKVHTVHGERHPELTDVRATFDELRADLEPHLMKEERVLFPMIRELAVATSPPQFHCGSLRNPISVMLREHETTGELLERLREITNGYQVPADGCASYRALYDGLAQLEDDTHLHVHKESNVLFPAVLERERQLSA
ncbi:MAG TPA: iron-sulfur cluster repair di-iron protein [Acidimicrobiales bacterium]